MYYINLKVLKLFYRVFLAEQFIDFHATSYSISTHLIANVNVMTETVGYSVTMRTDKVDH